MNNKTNVLSETKKDLTFEQLLLFPMEKNKTKASEEQPQEKRPKYINNYLGSKQKLVDWIWRNTPDGVSSVLDAFSGSAVVAYMYKSKGLRVFAVVSVKNEGGCKASLFSPKVV